VTRRFSSFFRIFGNIRICFENVGQILLYFFLAALLRFGINLVVAFVAFATPVLAATVVGLLLFAVPPVLGAANIWMLVYFATPIGKSVLAYEKRRMARKSNAGSVLPSEAS
jgi:hypothetical protein